MLDECDDKLFLVLRRNLVVLENLESCELFQVQQMKKSSLAFMKAKTVIRHEGKCHIQVVVLVRDGHHEIVVCLDHSKSQVFRLSIREFDMSDKYEG